MSDPTSNHRTDIAPALVDRSDGLWVVNKPAGWVTHTVGDPSIPDVITYLQTELGAESTLAAVHRLDRETSGVLLLSESADVRREIGRWLEESAVEKSYLAMVYGRCHRKGIVRRPLKDARRGRPLEATTRYRLKEWIGPCSHIVARPEHGRKHQIRRHLQAIGHAVLGDRRYRSKRRVKLGFPLPNRLWLHAWQIRLPDGRQFEAPLPADLSEHLALLKERSRGDSKGTP